MTLHSPIDGVVQRVNLQPGEVVDSSSDKDGACFVIKNDPLWVQLMDISRQPGKQAGGFMTRWMWPSRTLRISSTVGK